MNDDCEAFMRRGIAMLPVAVGFRTGEVVLVVRGDALIGDAASKGEGMVGADIGETFVYTPPLGSTL